MKKKQHKRVAALALTVALTVALTGCGSDSQEGSDLEQMAGTAVQIETVSAETISAENTVSGQVGADNERSIYIATSAKCTAVNHRAGDSVQAGEVICTLDLGSTLASYHAANISYQSSTQSYQDQAAVFESQIALYQKNLDNTKALYEIGAASQTEIDQAELQLQSAVAQKNATLSQLEAGIQSAKSNVEQLSIALENVDDSGNVIAPISGTLVSMNAVENSMISTSMPVAVIDGVDQMKVTVSVSEALVPKLTIGDSADIAVSAAGKSFVGTIRSVDRAANLQTTLYTVTLSVPADVAGLLSGMFADVTFHTETSENAIVVPSDAILTNGDLQYVFVVEEDTAKYTEVTTGLTGNGVTEVTSGLSAGQQLVTVGQTYLTDGTPVRIVSGEE